MKKLLLLTKPLVISTLSLLIVSAFLRYYLVVNSSQLLKEFKNQNFQELYSMDTLKLSSRMNALSSVINWVCIEGKVNEKYFYKMERGNCSTGAFKQRQELTIPQANNIQIIFTTRLPKEVEQLFMLFLLLQSFLILALIKSTKNSEEEKRQGEIKLSKMARQMSHDIRSPLATFSTVINNLQAIPEEDLILLKKSVKRIKDISDTLLIKTKNTLQDSKNASAVRLVGLQDLISEVVQEKRLEFKHAGNVNLEFTTGSQNTRAVADDIEFKRLLSNLINNSVEAKRGSVINISLSLAEDNSFAKLSIHDNGAGIPADVLHNLGKNEVTTKSRGNGLGLLHCFERVKEWGGETEIHSQLNEGTTVTIRLPVNKRFEKSAVLIDDDELVKLTWASAAKKHEIDLITISSKEELSDLMPNVPKETFFYIDSDLGNGNRGEDLAINLHANGYFNLYMATGYTDEHFTQLKFLKGVLNKTPPWK